MRKSKKVKKAKWMLLASLFVVVLIAITIFAQSFSLVPSGSSVWIPVEGKVECDVTRIAYYPVGSDGSNIRWNEIDRKGEYFYCNAKTFGTDADFYDGCVFNFKTENNWFDFGSMKVCDDNGNCEDRSSVIKSMKRIEIPQDYKIYVNPNIAGYEINGQANVYGLKFNTLSDKTETDRCDLASAMTKGQLALLKDDPDRVKVITNGRISPGVYGVTFITAYLPAESNHLITKDGVSWFVKSPGGRYEVKETTNGKYVVTDNYVTDTSIQCIPNIPGYCDSDGRIIINDDQSASCTPGKIVSDKPIPMPNGEVCKVKCTSNGEALPFDCRSIPVCGEGKILNPQYECVESTKVTQKEICEVGGGKFTEVKNNKGESEYSCDYGNPDYFYWYLIIGSLLLVIVMLLIKFSMDGGRK